MIMISDLVQGILPASQGLWFIILAFKINGSGANKVAVIVSLLQGGYGVSSGHDSRILNRQRSSNDRGNGVKWVECELGQAALGLGCTTDEAE